MADDDPGDAREATPSLGERLRAWDAQLDSSSYYEILDVDERAGDREIQGAYQRFARAFHPDVHVGSDAADLDLLKRIFQRGAEAYRVLKNPELRMRYDMALGQRGHLRLLPSDVPPPFDASAAGRPLHELCRSAGAKLAANKAARLIDEGDLAGAKRELLIALAHDGSANPALTARIDALEVALYAMGAGDG
jgi:curved DNA-binding protein CbpA